MNKHYKTIKFLWNDNKIVMWKYIFHMISCYFLKSTHLEKRRQNKIRFQEIVKDKKEIISDVNYSESIKSKILLPTEDNGLTRDIVLNKIREPAETSLFIKVMKPNMNVIDIGSNLGYYLLLESKLTKGKIYGIEPNPKSFSYLKRNVELNNLNNTELFNMGISNKKDNLKFYISKRWNWSRFKIFPEHESDIIKTEDIEVNSLDNLFGDKKIGLVRMDVEGYEMNIIKGMNQLVKNNPNLIIFMEYHSEFFNNSERREFVDWLNNNNFKIKYIVKCGNEKPNKIKENVNNEKLINLYSNHCLVLKKDD